MALLNPISGGQGLAVVEVRAQLYAWLTLCAAAVSSPTSSLLWRISRQEDWLAAFWCSLMKLGLHTVLQQAVHGNTMCITFCVYFSCRKFPILHTKCIFNCGLMMSDRSCLTLEMRFYNTSYQYWLSLASTLFHWQAGSQAGGILVYSNETRLRLHTTTSCARK